MLTPEQQAILTSRFPAGLDWRYDKNGVFHFKNGTPGEQAAAQAIINSFDAKAEEAKQEKAAQLAATDIPFVRVIEDLVKVLVAKGAIKLDDLPAEAQARLAEREALRADHGEDHQGPARQGGAETQ